MALGEAPQQPAAQMPQAKPTGATPAPAVPEVSLTGGLAHTYGALAAPLECRGLPPMKGLPSAVHATPLAQGAAVAAPPKHQRAA